MDKKRFFRGLLILGLVLLVGAFFHFDLQSVLTLDNLKAKQAEFDALYQSSPAITIASYMAIYILITAASLPGAAILTLAGGALFGLWTGLVMVSFASTIGATCAFLIARFLLRDAIQAKFGDKLKSINKGIEKEGAFYLFSLRLIPLFPFFVINVVMGLTPIKTWTFFWVSQLGMLLGTLAYVNAGTQLSQITSLSQIISVEVLISFVFLAFVPFIGKAIVEWLRRRKLYAQYARPKTFDYNLIAIGGGAAGLVTSYIGSAVKAKVALIERHQMGGDCLNTGCVPSKALIKSANVYHDMTNASTYGLEDSQAAFDFKKIMQRIKDVISKIEPHDSVERYTSLGVDCIEGDATIESPYHVRVNGKVLTAKNIIIATGARPLIPSIDGLNDIDYKTSDTIWSLESLPKRLLILGAGAIGCELAQSFNRLGSDVTLVDMAASILPKEDTDVSAVLQKQLLQEDIKILTNTRLLRFEKKDSVQSAILTKDNDTVAVDFDIALLAFGRKPNTENLGLEALGIDTRANGTIETDSELRTKYPNIFACGDVAGPFQFTHTAAHQAWYAAVNALFGNLKSFNVDYRVIPWCTFTTPEVAHVGLNEQMAKAEGIAYEVTQYGIDDLDRAIADSSDNGFVKVLTSPGKDNILGVTIVGHHAGDIIAEFVLAMKYKLGLNKILGTIHIYPTLAEANKYAAGEWKKSHTPEKLLSWIKKYHQWRRG